MLENTLEQLRVLQAILNKKFEVENKLLELPKELERRDEVVVRMKENFLSFNDKRNALKKEIIVKRDGLEHLQTEISRLEKEVGKVSSQRDYEQIDRAIKENYEKDQELRRDLQIAERKIVDLQEELSNSESLLQNQEAALVEIRQKIEEDLAKNEVELKNLRKKETDITVSMDNNLVFKFERILKSRSGDGIVPIRKNVCYGCHMLLPLKIVNEVCKAERVITCPYCSKILFYDGENDGEEVENIEIAGLRDIIDAEEIVLDNFDDEEYHSFMQKDDLGSDEYIPSSDLEEIEDEEIADEEIDNEEIAEGEIAEDIEGEIEDAKILDEEDE